MNQPSPTRLETLLSYLQADPNNTALRDDAIEEALALNEADIALRLIGDGNKAAMDDRRLSQMGLAQLQKRDFRRASEIYTILRERGHDDPAITYNLAWARAMDKDFSSALGLLDEEAVIALPQAAELYVQLLHEAGEFDVAADEARKLFAIHPDHRGLAAAVSVLAIDVEDVDLAAQSARVAGDHPDALTTLGTLSLGEQDVTAARDQFEQALSINPNLPRALIGRGLAKLVSEDRDGAGKDLDRGAELFDDHLGSWIAAGWAYLLQNDPVTARQRFDHAMALDRNFAESYGSLAVLDVLEGKLDQAGAGIATAMKLDRQCMSAAFAQTLLISATGSPEEGRRLFEQILSAPLDDKGHTIRQAIARMVLR